MKDQAETQAAEKIDSLRAKIRRQEHLYYVLDMPEISDAEYVVEPKIDGLACSLIYEKGRFVRAATRTLWLKRKSNNNILIIHGRRYLFNEV